MRFSCGANRRWEVKAWIWWVAGSIRTRPRIPNESCFMEFVNSSGFVLHNLWDSQTACGAPQYNAETIPVATMTVLVKLKCSSSLPFHLPPHLFLPLISSSPSHPPPLSARHATYSSHDSASFQSLLSGHLWRQLCVELVSHWCLHRSRVSISDRDLIRTLLL